MSRGFFLFKFKYGGLRYELGNNIHTGDLSWLSGPFPPGDWNDLEIIRFVLKLHLDDNERVEADNGYLGEDPCVTMCPGSVCFMEDQHWHKKWSKVQNCGEMFNHWLKTFGILSHTFCHDIEKHSMCFRTCAIFAQLSFEVGTKKLFKVPDYDQEMTNPLGVPLPELSIHDNFL